MSISVMAMGRMKEKPYRQMADEYLKRLSRYGKFEACRGDNDKTKMTKLTQY